MLQGGPHNHTISGLACALKQATTPEFKEYQEQARRADWSLDLQQPRRPAASLACCAQRPRRQADVDATALLTLRTHAAGAAQLQGDG